MEELEQRERLINVLSSLEKVVEKQTALAERQVSYKFIFLRGAIYGLGTVIGATILLYIASFLFVQLFGFSLFETLEDQSAVELTQ